MTTQDLSNKLAVLMNRINGNDKPNGKEKKVTATLEAKTEKATEEKSPKSKLAAKLAAKKVEEETKPEEEEEKEEEPEDEETDSFKTDIGSLVPTTSAEGELRTSEVRVLIGDIDTNRTAIGHRIRALRQRVKASKHVEGAEKAAKRQAKSGNNCFSLTPFKNEEAWGLAVGTMSKNEAGKVKKNVHQQCVLLSILDVSLKESGVAAGNDAIGKEGRNILAASSKKIIAEVVPELAKAALAGKDGVKLRAIINEGIASYKEEHTRTPVDLKDVETEALYNKTILKIAALTSAIEQRIGPKYAEVKRMYDLTIKRKDLTPKARKEVDAQFEKFCKKTALQPVKLLGIDISLD